MAQAAAVAAAQMRSASARKRRRVDRRINGALENMQTELNQIDWGGDGGESFADGDTDGDGDVDSSDGDSSDIDFG